MKLNDKYYNLIKNGNKTIELRLYDDKRKLLKKNDKIQFKNRINNEIIITVIDDLIIFESFKNALEGIDVEKCIPGSTLENALKIYEEIYEEKYKINKVIAIFIRKVNLSKSYHK
tara:strand:+ start:225 stop:569 length:345 start_codon:yes stop_codon:yes gene_type:complete